MRYPAAEWRPFPSAGRYAGGPKRLVIHTTEGYSIAGAEAAYRAKNVAPHFTVDPKERRWVQHVDTSVSSSAMANRSGGVQTNRRSAIQVEVVGFAGQTQHTPDGDLAWLGEVLFAICWTEGIPMHVHPTFVGAEAGTIATTTAPQRMSFAEWDAFHGVCGHQHVPENTHWDPGRFPYDRMMSLIQRKDEPLMALSDQEQERLLRRVDAIYERMATPDVLDGKPAIERSVVERRVSAIYLALPELADSDVDETEVARLVLSGLDPGTIAAAVPNDFARQVVDELVKRLGS